MARVSGRLRAIAPLAPALLLLQLWARPSNAEEPPQADPKAQKSETPDRFSVSGRSETYVQLYRRALVPGQNGQVVPTEVALPVHAYLFANARDVDAPWQKDSIGLEFAAWGRYWPTDSSMERPFDGDVQTASIRLDAGPAWTRIGRQQVAGGAARYARFDGIMVGARHLGLFVEGYAGFTVLPRWNAQPGYHQLGSAEDTLLVYHPAAPLRGNHWLAGGERAARTRQHALCQCQALARHHPPPAVERGRRSISRRACVAPVATVGALGVFDRRLRRTRRHRHRQSLALAAARYERLRG